jgi:chaperonin GroES
LTPFFIRKGRKQMNIKPLGNRVAIRVIETQDDSNSGIILPDSIKERSQFGEVVAIGRGNGKQSLIGLDVKVEHVILFFKHAGTKVTMGEQEYLILEEKDILAIKV